MVAGAPQAANGPWSPETVVNTSPSGVLLASERARSKAQPRSLLALCWARGQKTAQACPHLFALAKCK